MYKDKSVAVVVPAYNEERLIAKTLSTMPDFVDRVYVINDGSKDRTGQIIAEHAAADPRVILLDHPVNKGLGASLIDGYLASRDDKNDITAIMAGDAQMDPADLPSVLDPIAEGWSDYVKGNRLLKEEVVRRMPRHRFIGNSVLTLLTKFSTGYWQIIDPQCGYTAISMEALSTIPIQDMIKGYGYNAHILNMLNLSNFRVCDVEVNPVYGEEVSGINLKKYVASVSMLLLRLFIRRLWFKYMVREFNPLILFYAYSLFNFVLLCGPLLVWFIYKFVTYGQFSTSLIILTLCASNAFFSLIFAMWFDMEDNRRLVAGAERPRRRKLDI